MYLCDQMFLYLPRTKCHQIINCKRHHVVVQSNWQSHNYNYNRFFHPLTWMIVSMTWTPLQPMWITTFGFTIEFWIVTLLENQVLCHYILPFKSSFRQMWCMPFHHTLVVVKGNATMLLSWLFKWNGIHAIPLCNGYSGREYDNLPCFLLP